MTTDRENAGDEGRRTEVSIKRLQDGSGMGDAAVRMRPDREPRPPGPEFVAMIREAVETLSCAEAYPSVRQTADFVGMSVRTLQRRLAAAGVRHEALVAESRFTTAALVLDQPNAKILDLALDLGYADHANFTRAFRRWAGCSPTEYRSRHARASQPVYGRT